MTLPTLTAERLSLDTIEDVFNAIQAEKEDSDPDYWKKRYQSLLTVSLKHITALQEEIRRFDITGVAALYFPAPKQ